MIVPTTQPNEPQINLDPVYIAMAAAAIRKEADVAPTENKNEPSGPEPT